MTLDYRQSVTRWICMLAVVMGCSAGTAYAQFGSTGEIIRSGQEDANLLAREYLKPMGQGFGATLNSGWNYSSRPHRTLGFDVRVNASVALVPDTDLLFNAEELVFNEIQVAEGGPETPTVLGDDFTDLQFESQRDNPQTGEPLFEFHMPEGTNFPYVPGPMVQASVGIIKDTDVSVRFLPPISYDEVDLGLFGVGVRHGLNQWLPGGALLPVDLTLQAGFTTLNASIDFDVQPEVDSETENEYPATTWDGQQGEFSANTFTMNAIVGKTLPIISVFGGLGFETATVSLGTPGAYPVTVPNEDYQSDPQNEEPKKIDRVDDPIDVEFDGANGFHALAGFRLKLAVFNVSASYTLGKYPVGQVGVGIGIR